jgi:pyrroloquinoline quinone (PQQ) biosynthesis protein C
MDQALDRVTARWNLLHHTFYQRWTDGELTRDELRDYVKQYAHVVRALPGWLGMPLRSGPTSTCGTDSVKRWV